MNRRLFTFLLLPVVLGFILSSTFPTVAQQYYSSQYSLPYSGSPSTVSGYSSYPYSYYPPSTYRYPSYPYSPRYPIAPSIQADEGVYYDTPQSSTELGLRYLKLGNTYRESRNMDMAQYYLRRGLELVRGRSSRYWEGVGNEYLGLAYRDMGDRQTALEYLRRAESLYRGAINPLRTQSSLDAVQKIVSDVDYGWRYLGRPTYYDAAYNRDYSSSYSSIYPNQALINTYASEAYERDRLQRANMVLQYQLQDLEARLRLLEQPIYPGR